MQMPEVKTLSGTETALRAELDAVPLSTRDCAPD